MARDMDDRILTKWEGETAVVDVYYIGGRGKLHIKQRDNAETPTYESQCGRIKPSEATVATATVPKTGNYSGGGAHLPLKYKHLFCKSCASGYRAPSFEEVFSRNWNDDNKYEPTITFFGDYKKEFTGYLTVDDKPKNTKIPSPKINDDLYVTDEQLEKATGIILDGIDTNKVVTLVHDSVLEQIQKESASLKEEIQREISKNTKTITIKGIPKAPEIKIENPHMSFTKLINLMHGGMNVLLVGPSGSFKTTSSKQAAEAMGLDFRAMSLGPTITESKVFGFMNANGGYVSTDFRHSYEHGGCFLFDEFDAGHPSVLVTLNAALENGYCPFPDKMVKRHPNFVAVASANTFGRGADRVYNGRNQIDGATMERFVVLNWDYDENLEHVIAGDKNWTYNVQSIRKACDELKIRHIVSPRASIMGARLLKSGQFEKKDIEEMLIWKGLDRDSMLKIRRKAKEIYNELTGVKDDVPAPDKDSGDNPFA